MIFIATSNDRTNLSRLVNLNWIYFGSYRGLEQITGVLNQTKRRFIAKDIADVTNSVRKNFIDYIGMLSQQQEDKVVWYSSPMASKATGQTSIFHQYVYQKLLEKLLQEKKEDILVVTDNRELVGNVKRMNPERVRVLSNHIFYRQQIYDKIKGYLRILIYFSVWFSFKPLKNKELKKFSLFIHSWIDDRVFSRLPEFTDSYLGDLGNFLADRGYRVGRLVPLRLPLKYTFELQKSFTNIVYPVSYLTFADLIKNVFTKFSITINTNALTPIKDLKILNFLTKNEMIKENRSKAYLRNLLLFYSYKNLASRLSKNVPIIYPFENQPWEKVLNLAFVKFNRIAYQHSVVPSNWLDYRVSKYEYGAPVPKTILTTGKKWSLFLKEYYDNSIIEEAGAIRFAYLFNMARKQSKTSVNRSKSIVVALPISPGLSLLLQKQLLNSLEKVSLMDYTINIKPHPYLPKFARLEDAFAQFKNCQFTRKRINELFKDCALMITSGSTVTFESVLSGIKTLYFVPEEVSSGLEGFIREHLFLAYEEDFFEKLKEALQSTRYPKVEIEDYFSPPNYNVFLKYLNAENKR